MKKLPLSTPLRNFERLVEEFTPAAFHLVVEGIPGVPRVRQEDPKPQYFIEDDALAFVVPGSETHLPVDNDVRYSAACTSPGLVLVDKSQFVSPRYSQYRLGSLPVYRRPPGFGKTFFLSLLEDYVAVDHPDDLLFPRGHDFGLPIWSPFAPYVLKRQLLVLHLDMADLRLSVAMDEAELRLECRRFLSFASTSFYHRYRTSLNMYEDSTEQEPVTFDRIMALMRARRYKLFVGIDNYTSPLWNGTSELLEAIVVSEIFAPVFAGLETKVVRRGFMVGNHVPSLPFKPYCSSRLFNLWTTDLTLSMHLDQLLGLSEAEIVALGSAVFGPNSAFLEQVRSHTIIPMDELQKLPEGARSYATRDVIAFARAVACPTESPASRIHVSIPADFEVARPPLSARALEYAQKFKYVPRRHSSRSAPEPTKNAAAQIEHEPDSNASSHSDLTWRATSSPNRAFARVPPHRPVQLTIPQLAS
ncbi:hypothetical protein AURDEDRAFT_148725 [Auricularia subglabra TFB-10046 SS5]|nr:hypothetical protein AURDEDRAFT_148725 [Auricularia subglabra TFB-10046 SS5]